MLLQTTISITGGGVVINAIIASSLPSIVVENQIVVITDTPAGTIYVGTDEPANPANGDIWVKVAEGGYGVRLSDKSPYCDLSFSASAQYNNATWKFIDGYVGGANAWNQFGFRMPAKGTPLSEWTWAELAILGNSGRDPREYFAVGDTKDLLLSTGEIIPYVLGDFYKNTITGTGKQAPMAFTPHPKCLNTKYTMNNSATNAGGWNGSKLRNTDVPAIFNTFPAELKADGAIKYVDVVSNAGGSSTTLITTSDRLRPHSITELGLVYSVASIEGTPYAYYVSGNRIKTIQGSAAYYWTRSARVSHSGDFCYISTTGAAASIEAHNSFGVALAFDI